MNTSIKEPRIIQYDKYGKEYKILLRHRINMWNRYKIYIHIDNQKYGLKTYNKRKTFNIPEMPDK